MADIVVTIQDSSIWSQGPMVQLMAYQLSTFATQYAVSSLQLRLTIYQLLAVGKGRHRSAAPVPAFQSEVQYLRSEPVQFYLGPGEGATSDF